MRRRGSPGRSCSPRRRGAPRPRRSRDPGDGAASRAPPSRAASPPARPRRRPGSRRARGARVTTSAEPIQAAWWSSEPTGEPPTTPRKSGPTVSTTTSRCPRSAASTTTSCESGSSVSCSPSSVAPRARARRRPRRRDRAPSRRRARREPPRCRRDHAGRRAVRRPQRHVPRHVSPPGRSRSAPCAASRRMNSGPLPRRTACATIAHSFGSAPASSRSRTCASDSPSSACASAFVSFVCAPCSSRSRRQSVLDRLRRVVDRLAVVRVGSRLEEHAGQLRVVRDAGGAVERRHRAVLVVEGHVRVGAAREEVPRERRRRKARMADVEERRPAPRPARRARVALPTSAEHEPCPRIVGELRAGGEQRFRACALPVRRRQDERLRVRLDGRDERRPARVAVLACEHELCSGEDRLPPSSRASASASPARAARTSSFACLRSCSRFTTTSLRRGPSSASPGRRRDRPHCVLVVRRGGHCPTRGPEAPSRRLVRIRRATARSTSVASSVRFQPVCGLPGRPASGSAGSSSRGTFATPAATSRTSSPRRAAATETSGNENAAARRPARRPTRRAAAGKRTAVTSSPGAR